MFRSLRLDRMRLRARRILLQLLAFQSISTADGINSCLDPRDTNYRCGTHQIFLTRCGLADDDFRDVTTCLDATLGGRNAVTHVFFVGNDITALPDTAFQGLSSLQVLVINGNGNMKTLHKDAFAGSRSLLALSIVGNGLTELHPDSFVDQRGSLLLLYINNNRALMNLSEGLFAGLRTLKRLVVSFTGDDYPGEGMLADLNDLDHLTIVAERHANLQFNPFSRPEGLRVMRTVVRGDERDDLHCVPDTGHAKVRSNLQGLSERTFPRQNGVCGDWDMVGKSIVLSALGEPKSGTTWLGRVMTALAFRLCGAPLNQWCRLNALAATFNFSSDRYDFEMTHAGTGTPFLRFEGENKHTIPGLDNMPGGCHRGGRGHANSFDSERPCDSNSSYTRERLLACLPDTVASRCDEHFQGIDDPSSRRYAVVIRDPRDVVISEHRMRKTTYLQDVPDLDTFIRVRFETMVAWINLRWVWHTTALKASTHLVFLEDFQVIVGKMRPYEISESWSHLVADLTFGKAGHHGLVDLAAFMGLACSPDQALQVWRSDPMTSSYGDYTTYGLPTTTLAWMDEIMSKLLPQPMLDRWGLAAHVSSPLPIDSTSTGM